MNILEKLKEISDKLNAKGIPVPMLRDPKTGMGSISLTMLFISFNTVLVGIIGKWGKGLDVDLAQALNWFLICSGLYFGRNLTNSNGKVNVSNENQQ